MASGKTRHTLKGEHIYDEILFPCDFPKDLLDSVKHEFELRDDDVLIATYPKSGTTWMQEIVWLIMNDVNIEGAMESDLDRRIPFLEVDETDRDTRSRNIDALKMAPSPRIIKTHLPCHFFKSQLTKKKTKVILGMRNIKDTLVSFYHFYRLDATLNNMTGPFGEFFELFQDKHLAFGDWFDINLSYWDNRDKINLHLVKYEDLHKNFYETVREIATFLGKDISNVKMEALAKHVAFDSMKKNERVNKENWECMNSEISPFMRKGKVGDWKNYFTDEQSIYVDDLCKEKLKGTGLTFDYEL